MSIKEVNARVKAWGAELERRAAEWVKQHPEAKKTYKVSIVESFFNSGVWFVYVGETKYYTFSGHGAHQNAIDAMKRLIEKNSF